VIGYCEEGDRQISIYEYMPGGTLEHLHDKGLLDWKTHALDWKTRLQIALHIAQGLQYLGKQPIGLYTKVISTDNIFLTENWVPKSILAYPGGRPVQRRQEQGYVICVELSMLFQPTFLLMID